MGEGFRGPGGMTGLKILVGSRPAVTREGALWIDVPNLAKGCMVSALAPQAPIEGSVWVKTGPVAPASLAGKISPHAQTDLPVLGVYQFAGGAWVQRAAQIYKAGIWVSANLNYLYHHGAVADITGGFSVRGWGYGAGGSRVPSLIAKNKEMQISYSGSVSYAGGALETAQDIDLTDINKLVIDYDFLSWRDNNLGSSMVRLLVIKRSSGKWDDGYSKAYVSMCDFAANSPKPMLGLTRELDVSAITGLWDIGVGVYDQGLPSIVIHSIRME